MTDDVVEVDQSGRSASTPKPKGKGKGGKGKGGKRKGTPKIHATSTQVDSKIAVTAASKQTKAAINRIKLFRRILLTSVILTGIVGGYLSFHILQQKEEDTYNAEFRASVAEIIAAVDAGLESKVSTLEHMSTIDSFRCPDLNQWPNCSCLSVDYFEAMTDSLMDVSKSRIIAIGPIVYPHQQHHFENFANDEFESEGFPANTGVSDFGKGLYAKYDNGSRYHDISAHNNFSEYDLFVPIFHPSDLESNWPRIMYNMVSKVKVCGACSKCCVCAAVVCHVVLWCAEMCCVLLNVLCHVMLCHVMLCHVVL
jgi:hypothetical protein